MNRIFLYTVLLLSMVFNTSGIASSSEFKVRQYKTYIREDNIYRIAYEDFLKLGIAPGDIQPSTLRVINLGKEIPVFVDTAHPGVFQKGDYIEFYGTFLRGSRTYYNLFTRDNAYFISWGGPPRDYARMTSSTPLNKPPANIAYTRVSAYRDFIHMEETHHHRNFEFAREKIRDHWMWTPLIGPVIHEIKFKLSNLYENNTYATIRGSLVGLTHLDSYPDHHVMIFLNGHGIGDITFDGQEEYFFENTRVPMEYLKTGDNAIQLCLPLDISNEDTKTELMDIVSLNWVEIKYWKILSMNNNKPLIFTVTGPKGKTGGYTLFTVQNVPARDIDIYNISKGYKIFLTKIVETGKTYTVEFLDKTYTGPCKYLVTTQGMKGKIQSLEQVTLPGLNLNKTGQVDLIVISHPKFLETLVPYTRWKETQGISTLVVSTDQVYYRYNHGNMSPVAIKDFLYHAFQRLPSPKPRYVLLVGDANYDYKDFLETGVTCFLPSYNYYIPGLERCASDNWFVTFDKYYPMPSMAIGRLPVRTNTELESILAKLMDYEMDPVLGPWRSSILFIAGTGSSPGDVFYHRKSNELITDIVPSRYNVQLLYLEHSKAKLNPVFDPTPDLSAKQLLFKYFRTGQFFIHFNSHGGGSIWADRDLLTLDDVDSIPGEKTRFPLILSMTCYTCYFDNPSTSSIGEELLKLNGKGAIAFFGFSGRTSRNDSHLLSQELLSTLFQEKEIFLGDLLLAAYRKYIGHYGNWQFLKNATLLGDPTTLVKLPSTATMLEYPYYIEPGTELKIKISNSNLGNGKYHAGLYVPGYDSHLISRGVFNDLNQTLTLTIPKDCPPGLGKLLFYAWNNVIKKDQLVDVNIAIKSPYLGKIVVTPMSPTCYDPINFSVVAHDPEKVKKVTLSWTYNTKTDEWDRIPMVNKDENLYVTRYPVPPVENAAHIYYYVKITNYNNTGLSTEIKKLKIKTKPDIALGSIRVRWLSNARKKLVFKIGIRNYGDIIPEEIELKITSVDTNQNYEDLAMKKVSNIGLGERKFVYYQWDTPSIEKNIVVTLDPYEKIDDKNRNNNKLVWKGANIPKIKLFNPRNKFR